MFLEWVEYMFMFTFSLSSVVKMEESFSVIGYTGCRFTNDNSVVLIMVMFIIFLCSGFRSPLSHLLCLITVFLIIFVSLWCFTDEVEDLYADQTHTHIPPTPPTHPHSHPPPPSGFQPIVSRRFFCCSSSLFVRLRFDMWCLFCPYLFLISPAFGISERLCFETVVFPGYLYLCFWH